MIDSVGFSEHATVIKYDSNGNQLNADGIKWHCKTKIMKYKSERDYIKNNPYEVVDIDGNTALDVGLNKIWNLVAGDNTYPLSSAYSHIGIGNSSAAALRSQTGLLGSQTSYKSMDQQSGNSYPVIEDNIITFRAKFGPRDANFAWNEWGILNGDPTVRTDGSVVQFNRKVQPMGTKEAGSTWVIMCDISLDPL